MNDGLGVLCVNALVFSGTNLFAGTTDGVFVSTDNGTKWNPVNSGLQLGCDIWSLASSPTELFAGTNGQGVFVSTNNGASWTAVDSGLSDLDIRELLVSNKNVFAASNEGVFFSTNEGAGWSHKGLDGYFVEAFDYSDTNLLGVCRGTEEWAA